MEAQSPQDARTRVIHVATKVRRVNFWSNVREPGTADGVPGDPLVFWIVLRGCYRIKFLFSEEVTVNHAVFFLDTEEVGSSSLLEPTIVSKTLSR